MTTSVDRIMQVAERLWPSAGAEEWDAVGLIAGDPQSQVSRIVLAVDAVIDTVDDALDQGADMLFVHHPLLLRGVTTVDESTYKGAILSRLIRSKCALMSAHTNADIVERGTSGVIADKLGLVDIQPIVGEKDTGLGRVGRLDRSMTLGRLARALGDIVPPTAGGIRVAGDFDHNVTTVAVCGGAGDSLLGEKRVRDADVYITSDLRHHPASEARENARLSRGPALVDVSHWASEWLWLEVAASQLRSVLPDIEIIVSTVRSDPWDFAIVQ